MSLLMEKLNDAQKEAACEIDRHVRIVAGAGSGKTSVLMARIEYLINELGIWPNRIMAITFTNKAAQEMKDRLASAIGFEDASTCAFLQFIHFVQEFFARTVKLPIFRRILRLWIQKIRRHCCVQSSRNFLQTWMRSLMGRLSVIFLQIKPEK